jgi:hypothetical protein
MARTLIRAPISSRAGTPRMKQGSTGLTTADALIQSGYANGTWQGLGGIVF